MAVVLRVQWWPVKANPYVILTETSLYVYESHVSYVPCRMSLGLVDIWEHWVRVWGIWRMSLFQKKSCSPTLGFICFSRPILKHYFIHRDSSLCGLLARYTFSTQTRHLASCISTQKMLPASTQVPPRVLFQHTRHVMIPHPRCSTRTTRIIGTHTHTRTPWQRPTDTYSHPPHNRHSSHWRNLRDPPWGMTPCWKHPAVTASHTKLSLKKKIYKSDNQYLTSVFKLGAASHQKAEGWSISQHTCHPLPPPPLIRFTLSRPLSFSLFSLTLSPVLPLA